MKIFRDPIHNVIDLDMGDDAVNELILRLIDTREFQRLRWIRQLGFAYVAYPGATHTRFEHSLGAAFVAKKLVDKVLAQEGRLAALYDDAHSRQLLARFFARLRGERNTAVIAALLHDIGHGPFSHVFEEISRGRPHEVWTKAIILGDSGVRRVLEEYDTRLPRAITDILGGAGDSPAAGIIAGQMDVDKIDYLLRDSYMTGAGYGRFDVEWLFNVVTAGLHGGRAQMGLDLGKGLSVAEDFVMARIYMYRNIYRHKTGLAAARMLGIIAERTRELAREGVCGLFADARLGRIMLDTQAPAEQLLHDYTAVSDIDLLAWLKHLHNAEDAVLRQMSRGILERRLEKDYGPGEYCLSGSAYRDNSGSILLFDKRGVGFTLDEISKNIPTPGREDVWD
ncbi:MAG: HD domain-containing protein [Defluviitaleaceae bacterium]|nr:HD domain-containing protein [Defluviitaleaceae bacterium]